MSLVAAITPRALPVVRALAPPQLEIAPLSAAALQRAAFVVPHNDDEALLVQLAAARTVRVVQTLSAGTDWVEPFVPAGSMLCSARGSRDLPVAEWVVGALLGDAYGLLRAARVRTWERTRPRELAGRTVVILGYGSIGRALGERLAALGVEVLGVAHTAHEGIHSTEELPALLPRADALVVLLPLTAETRGMVDADLLSRLPDGALVVNAGRGAVVDTDALVRETASGRLRAVLDVVDPEPLPDDHPLWGHALAITPHNAGDVATADDRASELAAAQLARFVDGRALVNVVRAPAPRA